MPACSSTLTAAQRPRSHLAAICRLTSTWHEPFTVAGAVYRIIATSFPAVGQVLCTPTERRAAIRARDGPFRACLFCPRRDNVSLRTVVNCSTTRDPDGGSDSPANFYYHSINSRACRAAIAINARSARRRRRPLVAADGRRGAARCGNVWEKWRAEPRRRAGTSVSRRQDTRRRWSAGGAQ